MDHNVFHLGIVDGALGIRTPRVECAGIIGKHPDNVDRVEIEIETLWVLDPSAEDEVEAAHAINPCFA
jgi:hypothetical protein